MVRITLFLDFIELKYILLLNEAHKKAYNLAINYYFSDSDNN